jgi:4-hydroxybutyryl-CoA dehydratase / vinylacetyl-CoA-Delta-isomerase
MQLEYKKRLAKNIANVIEGEANDLTQEQSEYFDRVFAT